MCTWVFLFFWLLPDQRRAEWLDKLRRGDMARYESEVASRAKESTHTTMLMGLLEEWGLDNDARKAQRDRDAEAGSAHQCVCGGGGGIYIHVQAGMRTCILVSVCMYAHRSATCRLPWCAEG